MVGRPARRPDRTTAVNSGRRRRRACAGNTSGGEVLATLAPTTGEDRPAGTGAHPQPKAVHLGTTAVVRLEGALAHDGSLSGKTGSAGTARCGGRPTVEAVGIGPGAGTDSTKVRIDESRVKHSRGSTTPLGTGPLRRPAARDEFRGVPCRAVPRAVSVPAVGLPHRWTAGVRRPCWIVPGTPCRASPLRLHRLWTALWTSVFAGGRVGQGAPRERPPRKPSRTAGSPRAEGSA